MLEHCPEAKKGPPQQPNQLAPDRSLLGTSPASCIPLELVAGPAGRASELPVPCSAQPEKLPVGAPLEGSASFTDPLRPQPGFVQAS